jgi:hypothetical protein
VLEHAGQVVAGPPGDVGQHLLALPLGGQRRHVGLPRPLGAGQDPGADAVAGGARLADAALGHLATGDVLGRPVQVGGRLRLGVGCGPQLRGHRRVGRLQFVGPGQQRLGHATGVRQQRPHLGRLHAGVVRGALDGGGAPGLEPRPSLVQDGEAVLVVAECAGVGLVLEPLGAGAGGLLVAGELAAGGLQRRLLAPRLGAGEALGRGGLAGGAGVRHGRLAVRLALDLALRLLQPDTDLALVPGQILPGPSGDGADAGVAPASGGGLLPLGGPGDLRLAGLFLSDLAADALRRRLVAGDLALGGLGQVPRLGVQVALADVPHLGLDVGEAPVQRQREAVLELSDGDRRRLPGHVRLPARLLDRVHRRLVAVACDVAGLLGPVDALVHQLVCLGEAGRLGLRERSSGHVGRLAHRVGRHTLLGEERVAVDDRLDLGVRQPRQVRQHGRGVAGAGEVRRHLVLLVGQQPLDLRRRRVHRVRQPLLLAGLPGEQLLRRGAGGHALADTALGDALPGGRRQLPRLAERGDVRHLRQQLRVQLRRGARHLVAEVGGRLRPGRGLLGRLAQPAPPGDNVS